MALDMLIQLIHLDTEAQSTSTFHFADALNRKLVHGLLIAEDVPQEIRIEFLRRHLPPKKNDDVRYYFFREAAATVNAAKASNVADNLLSILEIYDLTLPSSPSTSAAYKKQDHASPLTLQKAYQSAWQALLPRLTNQDQVKRVLSVFHKLVLPNLPKPNLFLDFFVYCCDLGALGVTRRASVRAAPN